ncbi:MAG: hypothetical protein U5L45_17830 [Saprospiraceae bacterium]|nr:hypothetical protein [Saprospiraceae bacterium]
MVHFSGFARKMNHLSSLSASEGGGKNHIATQKEKSPFSRMM